MVKEKVDLSENVIKDIHNIVLMEQLINEYNNDKMKGKHIIERVSLLHLKFEAIHPFIDGNGRTGRLLLNLELMKEGYPPKE